MFPLFFLIEVKLLRLILIYCLKLTICEISDDISLCLLTISRVDETCLIVTML